MKLLEKIASYFNDDEYIGQEWGMLGGLEESRGKAIIDRVDERYDSRTIGLTARQLDNLGADYGDVFLELENEDVGAEYVNAYEINSPEMDKGIIISSDLAEEYELSSGDRVQLARKLTETGELLHEVRNHDGRLGKTWDYIGAPQSVTPVFVDGDELDSLVNRVGLSAMQLENMGAAEGSVIQASYEGNVAAAEVYNAAGIRAVGGKGVRVSEPLAEELGVEQAEEFSINHVLNREDGDTEKTVEDVHRLLVSNNRRGQK